MRPIDLAVVVLYLVATLGLGLWRTRHQRTAGDYFLGARDLPAWAILLSIVATETSAITVISIPGVGARGDLTFLQLAFGYIVGRVLVAWWLLPGYFRGTQETAYVRLESRFGASTRRTASVIFLVTRFLGDAVRVFASGVPLAVVLGWSLPTSIVVLGTITLIYTWFGGFRAVVWTDVLQLLVYVSGGVLALAIAADLAGGPAAALAAAAGAGKLRMVDPAFDLTRPYTLAGGLLGGALLSAASHGTDHLIVQRLLASRSLAGARLALVGSGLLVTLQFTLFLLVGVALWAAGLAPTDIPADRLLPQFVVTHLPVGLAGLMTAGILAAAMSTSSAAINSLASSTTHDLYATWTGERDPARLLAVGRRVSLGWGVLLIAGALLFALDTESADRPVVVLALSIATVTSGALLGAYLLARVPRARGPDVIAAMGLTVAVMLVVLFAARLGALTDVSWLTALGRLAWPWYVPLGTLLCFGAGWLLSRRSPATLETA